MIAGLEGIVAVSASTTSSSMCRAYITGFLCLALLLGRFAYREKGRVFTYLYVREDQLRAVRAPEKWHQYVRNLLSVSGMN